MYINPSLHQLLISLIPKVLLLIEPTIKDTFLPKSIDNYPVLAYKKNGFPSISYYPSPIEISQFFKAAYAGAEPKIDLNKFSEMEDILKNIKDMPEIQSYYRNPNKPIESDRLFEVSCLILAESFIERYYYIHGVNFDISKFDEIYLSVENYIYSETIHFDITVPILFVKFDLDYLEVYPGIAIRRISDGHHRARARIKSYSPAIADSIIVSATHELVLHDFHYKKPTHFFDSPFSNAKIYPQELIEQFFTSLKIATDFTSGYAQLLVVPKDWSFDTSSDLPLVMGTSTRSYPSYFDDFYWNLEDFPTITTTQQDELKKVFTAVRNSSNNQIIFALKRFYKSTLRSEEEDIIIDLIIALEMLLSDNEKGEITHKLALRLATLLSKSNPEIYEPVTVFANVKKIYAYRSNIVHGAYKKKINKEIQLSDSSTVPIVTLTNEYLRQLLNIMLHEPIYLQSSAIDKLLLTGT